MAAVNPNDNGKAHANIPVLSYFTGAGFLDLGFSGKGFDIIWRNESNLDFVRGFQHGMAALHDTTQAFPVNTSCFLRLRAKRVMNEAFNGAGRPETFGIIGGPPCPDFSAGGKHRGGDGDHGRLTKLFVRHIIRLQPSFFVIENVFGLFKTSNHQRFFNSLKRMLRDDYFIDECVLNALDYGVPQHRERGFLIGYRKEWLARRAELIPIAGGNLFGCVEMPEFENAKTRYQWPSRTAFGGSPPKPQGIPAVLMVGTHICDPAIDLRELPNGLDMFRPYSNKFTTIMEGDDRRKSFKRLHRWRFSPTAAYGNNEVHLHPVHPRRLSVREVLRIQSVPDGYALPPDLALTHKFKMVGNGVPVRLAEVVASSVVKFMQRVHDNVRTEVASEHATFTVPQHAGQAPSAHTHMS